MQKSKNCQTVSIFFNVTFHMLLQQLFAKKNFKWFLCHIVDLMGAFYGIWNHKNGSICHFQSIKSLWLTVHNV